MALNNTETIFASQTDFMAPCILPERQLTNFERCVHKESLIAISVIDKSKLFLAITIIGKKLSPINYLDKCPSLLV